MSNHPGALEITQQRIIRSYADVCDKVTALAEVIDAATSAAEVVPVAAELDGIEQLMRRSGLYETKEIRPVNEARMRARWRLGQLLAEIERGAGPGRGKKMEPSVPSFSAYLKTIKLEKPRAIEAQRIGTLPVEELEKAFAESSETDILNTFEDLIVRARPYWYKAARKARHQKIASAASMTLQNVGPFALIYADPPWKFDTFSEKGLERTPDQHYETLTVEEIIDFRVRGMRVEDIAHDAAVLLLWCTSSNFHRALEVVDGWGFEFKTSAAWDKMRCGTGLIFRNWHEVLIYATRGNMPGPQYQPPSLFRYLRGRHSAKPPEVRKEIEKMYPDFDEKTRIELFARGSIPGWTRYGLEAK